MLDQHIQIDSKSKYRNDFCHQYVMVLKDHNLTKSSLKYSYTDMSDIIAKIKRITQKYANSPKKAINQLFSFMEAQPQTSKQSIKIAILYCMEKIHDWNNVCRYSQKWQAHQFRKGFCLRMQQRVMESGYISAQDTSRQLERMIQKYRQLKFEEDQENVYQMQKREQKSKKQKLHIDFKPVESQKIELKNDTKFSQNTQIKSVKQTSHKKLNPENLFNFKHQKSNDAEINKKDLEIQVRNLFPSLRVKRTQRPAEISKTSVSNTLTSTQSSKFFLCSQFQTFFPTNENTTNKKQSTIQVYHNEDNKKIQNQLQNKRKTIVCLQNNQYKKKSIPKAENKSANFSQLQKSSQTAERPSIKHLNIPIKSEMTLCLKRIDKQFQRKSMELFDKYFDLKQNK